MAEETLTAFRARLDGAAIFTYVLVMLVVPLKLWCRIAPGRTSNFGWDDACCIVAFLSTNAFFFVCMIGMRPALGMHAIEEVAIPEVIHFLKFLFAGQILYVTSLSTIKFSILALYWRLFSIGSRMSRIPILIGFFIVMAWAISVILVVIFTCDPIEGQWNVYVKATCISLHSVYVSGSTPNVITDLIILILPLPYVWRLKSPLGQRLILVGIFLLGSFVFIVSIVRLGILLGISLTSADTTFNTKEVIVWSIVEINMGLVGACLPSMKPALHILHLDRLFGGGSTTPPLPVNAPRQDHSDQIMNQRARGRKMGLSWGLFSTVKGSLGLSKLHDSEDSYGMISNGSTAQVQTQPKVGTEQHVRDVETDDEGSRRGGSREGDRTISQAV